MPPAQESPEAASDPSPSPHDHDARLGATGEADPAEVHGRRLREAQAEASALDSAGGRIAHVRLVTFLAALAFAILSYVHRIPSWGWGCAGGSLLLYALAAWHHGRLLDAEARAKGRAELSQRGLARLAGKWHAFPSTGERYLDPDHPYVPDLDLFGQGSLFQLLDETGTRHGEARLAGWLTGPAIPDEAIERQAQVRELAPKVAFREGLVVEGRLLARRKADPAAFLDWAEGPVSLDPIAWVRPLAWLLPLATLSFFILGRLLDVLPRELVWPGLFAQLLVVLVTRRRFGAYFEQLAGGEEGIARYDRAFGVLEAEPFEHPTLRHLQAGLGGERPVSERFARFAKLFGFAELRRNQLHAVVNLLTLWDIHWLFALEGWRKKEASRVRGWFDGLAQLEALGCLAAFAFEQGEATYPTFATDGPARFEARGLAHPLLDEAVANDVGLEGPGKALVVTGSNMSGKTTLLRAMGVNAVLAQAGGPVCAHALHLSPLAVVTSMRVKDSLERGVSYFYAEVERIRRVLEAAQGADGKALFLLDEILLGTNTRERQIASREVLRLLLGTGAIGAVTTHDMALTRPEGEPEGRVHNVHFEDQVDAEGRMTFDYRLREGVVTTSNALRLLVRAGIPLPPELAGEAVQPGDQGPGPGRS